jgi:hypothetical protein
MLLDDTLTYIYTHASLQQAPDVVGYIYIYIYRRLRPCSRRLMLLDIFIYIYIGACVPAAGA